MTYLEEPGSAKYTEGRAHGLKDYDQTHTALVDFAPWFASSKILDVVGVKLAWGMTGERENHP